MLLAVVPTVFPGTAYAQWIGGGLYAGWGGVDWRWVPPIASGVTVVATPVYPYGYPNYGYYIGPVYGVPGYGYSWVGNAYAQAYARG